MEQGQGAREGQACGKSHHPPEGLHMPSAVHPVGSMASPSSPPCPGKTHRLQHHLTQGNVEWKDMENNEITESLQMPHKNKCPWEDSARLGRTCARGVYLPSTPWPGHLCVHHLLCPAPEPRGQTQLLTSSREEERR